jgi:hypothetical protein
MNYIVTEALKTIPEQSQFYKCIADVITWHKKYPQDWHQTWFELQKKWSDDIACADGIFRPFNIDAKINSAYVVLGLLYGNGDFTKTMEVATRAGQDADCNPSSAGGVLGTIVGYNKIPDYWKASLKQAEDIDFKYTTVSLNKVYDIGLKHALHNIELNGGKVNGDNITIAVQSPATVKAEQGFPGVYPVLDVNFNNPGIKDVSFDFEGTGFLLAGSAEKSSEKDAEYVFEAEMYVDGKKIETAKFPTNEITRRLELFWQYALPKGKHTVNIKVLNPDSRYSLNTYHYIVFSDKPAGKLVKTQ